MDVHNKTVQLTLQIKLENSYFNYKKKNRIISLVVYFAPDVSHVTTVDRVVFN